ncbi:MAG: hypothetical protein GY874_05850 [Desulfobacteraceae bacterium]|nr:hypothetical protein [Desulfobacteraceae bacterium]
MNKKGILGRPSKFGDDVELTEIIVPNFPKPLDDRLNAASKKQGLKKIDVVRQVMLDEIDNNDTIEKYPLKTSAGFNQTVKRSFRTIPKDEWAEFCIKSMYHNKKPTTLLLELIQAYVLTNEGKKKQLSRYNKKIELKDMAPMNFSPKIPTPVYNALFLLATQVAIPAHVFINDLVNEMSLKQIRGLKKFPVDKKTVYSEPRLDSVDRKIWIQFRSHCLRSNAATHEMLATYLCKKIAEHLCMDLFETVEKQVRKILKPYKKFVR